MQPDATPALDPLAAHGAAVLAELTRLGLDIARALHAEATATPEAQAQAPVRTPLPALAAAFDRIARTVRRTVLLARHLSRPDPQPDPRPNPAEAVARARRHVLRTMENRITRNDERVENPDALRRELLERLEGADLHDDLLHRPLPEIIDDLCQDMGLHRFPFTIPYPRRTPADIARLLAQAQVRPPPGAAPGPQAPGPVADPQASPWTHSGPTRLAPPRGKPDAHGITPEDRALHAHILGTARRR